MEKIKFKELKNKLCIRRDVDLKQEDSTMKELESLLFDEGLVKKIVLDEDVPSKYYKESRLYVDNNEINGVILALNSIRGHGMRRNDHNIYIIGDEEFKKRITQVLRNKYFSKHL